MTKSLSLVMLLFVVFGCATLSEQPETPAAADPENQISRAETENVPSNTGIKLSNARERDDKQPASVTLDAEEIRQVQTLLKTVGFDPGRIDGAFGPKTKIALLRLRSSCAANRNNAARTMLRKEEIRVIQVRLKDAGFDPGPVDGISGPNTRAAVARFRSGCGAVRTMPPAVLEAARSMEPDDMSGPAMAKDNIMTVAIPGGAESSESGSFTSAATTDSSAGGTRRLP